jgi:DNA-binding IclR family transcriptional regulator
MGRSSKKGRPAKAGSPAPSLIVPAGVTDEQTGIQSIETGIRLLAALADLTAKGAAPMLKTLAAAASMPPAKAHRYLVSFMRTGLVEREPATGRYRLGPLSRHIGVSALMSLDVVRIAGDWMPRIRDEISETVALAIWGSYGPTIVRVEEYRSTVMVSTRVGVVVPMLSSATGPVFGAWMPRSATLRLITDELERNRLGRDRVAISTMQAAERLFAETRELGIGRTKGGLSSGINAVSAPIFDYTGTLVGALSSLGPADSFNDSPTGSLANHIKRYAAQISGELGQIAQASPSRKASATG